jgi:hypothetical protein
LSFLERSLAEAQAGTLTVDGRPQSVPPARIRRIEFVNPIEFQIKAWIDEVAEIVKKEPRVGIDPRRVFITTAPVDPEEAARLEVPSFSEAADGFRVFMQDPRAVIIPAGPLFSGVDTEGLRARLDTREPMDPIDALQAYTPTEDGRGAGIRTAGSGRKAGDELQGADHVLVLSGFPVSVGSEFIYEPESTVAAIIMAEAQVKLGKRVTLVTPAANLDALRAGLNVRGIGEDVEVLPFDFKGEAATAAAREIIDGLQPAESRIPVIGLGDVGNEAGGGAVAQFVPHVDGQAIASMVATDTFVTAGAGSWAAAAVVVAQERLSGRLDLLPTGDGVRQLWETVVSASVHGDEQLRALNERTVCNPTVHGGIAKLWRRAALAVPLDGPQSVTPASSGHGLAIVSADVPGRDFARRYRSSDGRDITEHVVPLDAFVLVANERNLAISDAT